MTWAELQSEHREWVDREYPGQPPRHPACGILEEAGELLHCVVKLEQERTWGPEARYAGKEWRAELIDGIGDCALYCCSLCNAQGWSFQEMCAASRPAPVNGRSLTDLVLSVIRAAVEVAALPDSWIGAAAVLSALQAVCFTVSADLAEAVETTWKIVKLRRNR